MDGSIRLGGNIELFGAEVLDGATMVVVKKIIGNYVRRFSERGLERLAVSFQQGGVSVEAVAGGNTLSGVAEHSNIFFSLDIALKEIEKQL